MKVVFAHDHIFYNYKENFYSNGGLGLDTLNRYTEHFEKLTILSRQQTIKTKIPKLTLSSEKGIEFVKVPDIKKVKNAIRIKETNRIIETTVKNADGLIARLPSSVGNIAIKYAKKYKIPYLIEVVGCSWDAYTNYGNMIGRAIAPIEYIKQKRLVAEAPFVLYVTKEFLQKRYPSKANTIDCSNVILKDINHEDLNKRLENIDCMNIKQEIVLGTIGNVNVKYKGQLLIIKALSELKKQGKTNFKYKLVGGGDNSDLLLAARKMGVENQVKFIGTLNHQDVFDFLENLDIYIQPSLTEGLPRALIEAMSKGLPCIASNVGGIPELIDSSYQFNPFKNADKQIINCLLKLNSKKELKEQANNNFEKSKNYYVKNLNNKRKKFLSEFKKYSETYI